MSPKVTALLASGFVLGWACRSIQALRGRTLSYSGLSQEKERVPDGGLFWTHADGFVTHIARRGEACGHCGATEDGLKEPPRDQSWLETEGGAQ